MVLLSICQATSSTPIKRTPGHLLRAIKQQAINAETPPGSTTDVHNLLATNAKPLHISPEVH